MSLLGGKDLTMAEVNRVMEQIGRHCEQAQVIMGAAVDAAMKDRLSVTVIAAKHGGAAPAPMPDASVTDGPMEPVHSRTSTTRPVSRGGSSAPAFNLEQREQVARQKCRPSAQSRCQNAPGAVALRSFPKAVSTKANRRFTRAKTLTSRRLCGVAWR